MVQKCINQLLDEITRRRDVLETLRLLRLNEYIQRVPQLFKRLRLFHVNKSCKIECCGNNMLQIVQSMTLTLGKELSLL